MRSNLLAGICLALSACVTAGPPIPHAPPEEAAKVKFPRFDLPAEGLQRIPGNMAASIQVAMEDFLPWGAKPASGSFKREPCLEHRASYDVTAAPDSEGVMLVRFALNPQTCETGESVVDMTTYAIDVRTMRILSIEHRTQPRSRE